MSSRNRAKRIQNRENRLSAVEEARQRSRRRRFEVAIGGIVLALIVAIAFVIHVRNDNKTAAPPKAPTAKPCVNVSSPSPKGAPAVPVVVGPPPTSLEKRDLKVGTGAVVTAKSTVKVNYVGVACTTGKIFDSSYQDGGPATFPLSGVIPGWQQGIPGMRVGGERLLGIPSALAYGPTGSGSLIGPNEPLWFVVQVLSSK